MHHADAPAHLTQPPPAQSGDIFTLEDDLAAGRRDKTVDATDQRRLARTGRTNHRSDAATAYLQIDILQDRLVRGVGLVQVPDDQRPFCRSSDLHRQIHGLGTAAGAACWA